MMKREKFRKSTKSRALGTLQRVHIKIGGSGGGSKSRSLSVFGCASVATVREFGRAMF